MTSVQKYPPAETGKYQPLGWMQLDDYIAIKSDMAAKGRMDMPLVKDCEGNILDGHHRDLAHGELTAEGVEIEVPATVIMRIEDEEEKRRFALSVNMNRRHLSREKRREIIAVELRRTPDISDSWMAQVCGTTDKTVRNVREELEAASEIPKVEAVRGRDGKRYPRVIVTNRRHEKEARNKLEQLGDDAPNKTMSVATVGLCARKKKRQQYAEGPRPDLDLDDFRLECSDFRQLQVEDQSVKVILTDPPYDKGALSLWQDLADFAGRVLVPGGLLVTYSGLQYLPEVMDSLRSRLNYVWLCRVDRMGKCSFAQPIKGRTHWRPVLVFSKGEYELVRGIIDVIPGGGSDKTFHNWQQPVSESTYLLDRLTQPDDVVCDPFAGSFTVALACYETGRHFVGCDIDESNVTRGVKRLKEAVEEHDSYLKMISSDGHIEPDEEMDDEEMIVQDDVDWEEFRKLALENGWPLRPERVGVGPIGSVA